MLILHVSFSHPPSVVLHSHRIRLLVEMISGYDLSQYMFSNPAVKRISIGIQKRAIIDDADNITPIVYNKYLIQAEADIYTDAKLKVLKGCIMHRNITFCIHSLTYLYRPNEAKQYPWNVAVVTKPVERADNRPPVLKKNGEYYIRMCSLNCYYYPAVYRGEPYEDEEFVETPDGRSIANVPRPFPGAQQYLRYLEVLSGVNEGRIKPRPAQLQHRRGRRRK